MMTMGQRRFKYLSIISNSFILLNFIWYVRPSNEVETINTVSWQRGSQWLIRYPATGCSRINPRSNSSGFPRRPQPSVGNLVFEFDSVQPVDSTTDIDRSLHTKNHVLLFFSSAGEFDLSNACCPVICDSLVMDFLYLSWITLMSSSPTCWTAIWIDCS